MLRESFEAARNLPENQSPVKQFALREAWHMLMQASVADPSTEAQQSETISGSRYDIVEISGSVLKSIRKARGLTQQSLVELARGRISRGYISMIEKQDPARISRTKAMLLATSLNTGMDNMLFRNDV